jgi:flagellar biosynthesis/type III secretory pathway chaperone
MNIIEVTQKVEQIIKQELNCLFQLDKLMTSEHEAIKFSNAEELTQLLSQKPPLILHLQELDKQRKQILTTNSMMPTEKVFNELVDNSESESLKASWVLLKEKLIECKNSNELNGRLIHMKKNNNDSVLRILLGNRQVVSQTYGSNGRTGIYSKSGLSAVV